MVYEDAKLGGIVWHKTLNELVKLTWLSHIAARQMCWAVRKDSSGEWDHWSREFAVHYSDLEAV